MKEMISGVTVRLKTKVQTGTDEFKRPVYEEGFVDVEDVLIGVPSSEDIVNELNLSGKRIAYTLGIPKGDTHNWINTEVEFWGERYRTIGKPMQGIDENIPLSWNKKVQVESYG